MNQPTLEQLRYPVGRFEPRDRITAAERGELIDEIAALPQRLRAAVEELSDEQLDTPYRPDGWTIRQVVHHLPDSHVNSYVRFKRTVTEERPTICTYREGAWAELADARSAPVELSLDLLDALHRRWTRWLRTLDDAAWERSFEHPELGEVGLELNLQLYAWHCRHHLAHVTGLRERKGW